MARPPVPEMPPEAMPPEGGEAGSTVVATICRRPDGTYEVYAGDEPEPAEEMGGEPMAEQAQSYDSIGQALKATMDILQEDAAAAGPEGTAEDNFRQGFET